VGEKQMQRERKRNGDNSGDELRDREEDTAKLDGARRAKSAAA